MSVMMGDSFLGWCEFSGSERQQQSSGDYSICSMETEGTHRVTFNLIPLSVCFTLNPST